MLVAPIKARRGSYKPSFWSLLFYVGLSFLFRSYRSLEKQRIAGRESPSSRAFQTEGEFQTDQSKTETRPARQGGVQERGRGRGAEAPWQIPWRGWKDILWRTYQELSDDRLVAIAAGVVFFALLALFPAITALVSIYGLFADPVTISEHLSLLAGILPQSALDIVQEQINRITSKGDAALGFGFIFGLGLALWSANAGMKAIIDALNVIYEEKEKRGFLRLNLTSLALTIGAILSLLLAVAGVIVLPLLLNYLGLGSVTEILLRVLRWPTLLVLVILGIGVLYRFAPSRTEQGWEWLTPGSLFAAFAWLAASALLSWYLANFANYDATYGSLGAAIGLMMWLWISSIVILFGAELNSEIEHQTARDIGGGRKKSLGARGAAVADPKYSGG